MGPRKAQALADLAELERIRELVTATAPTVLQEWLLQSQQLHEKLAIFIRLSPEKVGGRPREGFMVVVRDSPMVAQLCIEEAEAYCRRNEETSAGRRVGRLAPYVAKRLGICERTLFRAKKELRECLRR